MRTTNFFIPLVAALAALSLAGAGCAGTRTTAQAPAPAAPSANGVVLPAGTYTQTQNGVAATVHSTGGSVKMGSEQLPTGTTTMVGPNGQTITTDVRGPDQAPPNDFPKNFPVMPGMNVQNYTEMTTSGTSDFSLSGSWNTNASVGDVFGYYKTQLPQNGFTVTRTSNTTSGSQTSSIILFAKQADARYMGTMTLEEQTDGSTTVQMSYLFYATPPTVTNE